MDEVKKQTRRTPTERETEEVAEDARRLFFYHAETGLIIRRCYWAGKNVGEEAGTQRTDSDGMTYRSVSIKHTLFMSHRVAWLLHYGRWPASQVDHKDGNGLNNRIQNLSEVTNKQNAMNQKLNAKNSSGVTGVRWHKLAKKWTSRVVQDGREIYLGLFESFEDAVRARKDAESKYGFSDRHGTKEATVVPPTASDRIP
jgi:hypothetical protein